MDNHEGNALIYNFIYLQMEVITIPKRKDYTGQQFGDFKVVEMLWNYQNKNRTYCKCIGIDNQEYIIRPDALLSGATKTIHGACSGGKKHDISGQRFGRLVAIEETDKRASNGNVRWKCICDCGNYIYPTMSNLKRGHTTSCGCAKDDFIESCRDNIVGNKYGNLTVIKYVPSKRRRIVESICDCGNTVICDACSLTTGHTMSCGCMNQSKGEMHIREILDELNIKYKTQKRFADCRNKKTLPFDFYLLEYNICIEYDGEQHFYPVEFWGGEKRFEEYQQNDKIKDDYCKSKGIKLIRIKYGTTKNEIYEIIKNIVSPATITA